MQSGPGSRRSSTSRTSDSKLREKIMTDTQNESTWKKRQGELQRAIREHSLTARNAKAMLEYYLRLNCPEHQTTSHRDGHPKWCGRCGYTDQGVQLGAPNAEQSAPTTRTTFTVSEFTEEQPFKRLMLDIAEVNRANGWVTNDRSFGDDIALIHSEASEAYEEYRAGHKPGDRYYSDGTFTTTNARNADGVLRKPEGVPSELADVIIRVLDTCYRNDIDIDAVLAEKLEHNRTRGHRHGGKVV